MVLLQCLPEAGGLLGRAIVVAGDDLVEVGANAAAVELHVQGATVRIGGENNGAPRGLQAVKKLERAGTHGDTFLGVALHRSDIELELVGPEIQAIPVQGAVVAVDPLGDQLVRLVRAHPVGARVFLRHVL